MTRENDKIKFTLRDDNILHTECFPNTIMTLNDGKESTRISGEIINYEAIPLLCDLSNVVKISQDCRKHFAGPEHAETFNKCALIVTNPLSKMIGNFFLGLNKPLKPTRLFTSHEQGLEWLKKST